jgi:hypothetical protein
MSPLLNKAINSHPADASTLSPARAYMSASSQRPVSHQPEAPKLSQKL